MKKRLVILLAALIFAACYSRPNEPPPASQDALKELGGTMPSTQFDRSFWQREHDANSSAWSEAKRLCEQTMLANYPNCLPVNDIMQADQQRKAEVGDKAAAKIEEMGRRGYGYDYRRKLWLPDGAMLAAGCASAPAYPGNSRRIGFYTWQCPAGASIPEGIPDPEFSKEEENATD